MAASDKAIICCGVMEKVINMLKAKNIAEAETSIIYWGDFAKADLFVYNLDNIIQQALREYKRVYIVLEESIDMLDSLLLKFSIERISPIDYLEALLGKEEDLGRDASNQETDELKSLIWDLYRVARDMEVAFSASAKEHEQVLAQKKEKEDIFRHINKLGQIASSSLDINEFYQAFTEEIKTLIDCDRISIATVDERGENLVVFALAQERDSFLGQGKIIQIAGTATGWVIQHKRPSLANDLFKERHFIEEEGLIREGFRSALRVPLVSKGKIFGTINLNSFKPKAFSLKETDILSKIANQVATAINNAWLFAETERKNQEIAERNRQMAILNDISRVVSNSLDLKDILEEALVKLTELTSLSSGAAFLIDEEAKLIKRFTHLNVSKELMEKGKAFPLGEGRIGMVAQKGKPLIIQDALDDEVMRLRINPEDNVRSVVYIPLQVKNKVLGVLVAWDAKEEQVFQEDMRLLKAIGHQIGIAIENAKLYQQIKQLAEFDDLTGLLNRRMFYQYVRKELKKAVRYQKNLAILMIDLDRFKDYNDTYGHLAGDQALKNFGEALREAVRETDIPARYGGEEFAVLVLEAGEETALDIARRIQSLLKEKASKCPLPTVSIGIASFPGDGSSVEKLIYNADAALYEAKNSGRNRVVCFSKKLN